MTTTNFHESLNELVTDARFRSLALTKNFESFLDIYGINEAETMHTFSWFMAPKGSHGFNDVFMKEFLTNAWTMIHGQYGAHTKTFASSKFYTNLSPVAFQHTSFMNTFIDRDMVKEVAGADIVITDVATKVLVVINNKFNQAHCDKAVAYFGAEKFNFFENKIFVSFDGEAQASTGSQWMYMNNEWLINVCANLIEGQQGGNWKANGIVKEYYQFLTGTPWGTSHEQFAEASATLIADYYDVITTLKTYKTEVNPGVALIDINPREYATTYFGKVSQKEYEILSLYWSHRNTFNTFFQAAELEAATKNLAKTIEGKSYGIDRTYIRNGLSFTPSFAAYRADKAFMNTIFDVEMVWDMNKNLNIGLVVNKASWDKLTAVQRHAIKKDFGFTSDLLNDRVTVASTFFKQDWKNQDLTKVVTNYFDKVHGYLGNIGVRVA